MNLSKNLKQLRKARGLSQEGVARRIGITRVALSSYEAGRSEPKLCTLYKLSVFYRVTLDELCK